MSGVGKECVRAFAYFKGKIGRRLVKDGYPPLPKDYGFKLTPIATEEQMKTDFLYLARNPYEKHVSVPGGYLWGTAWLHHSQFEKVLMGTCARDLSHRELIRLTGSRFTIPDDWQFHPKLGLLPSSFVNNRLFYKLFPTPKDYETRLIKDYEAVVKRSQSLGDEIDFSPEEIDDLVHQLIIDQFQGKFIKDLTGDEKGQLCGILDQEYHLSPEQIAGALRMPKYLAAQFLRSKDYGTRR